MPVFNCQKYPELLVIGAGKFEQGRLKVNERAAKIVRKVAAKFEITEVATRSAAPKAEAPKSAAPAEPVEDTAPTAGNSKADDKPATDESEAGTEDSTEKDSTDENRPETEAAIDLGEAPAGNSSTDRWREYAITQGFNPEVLAPMSRDEIRKLVQG